METELIPTSEAAALLGVSIKTLNRWAENGRLTEVVKLPGLRGGRLFRRSDVEALVAAKAS